MEFRPGFYQIVIQDRPARSAGKVTVLTPTEHTAMHAVSNGDQVIYDRLTGNHFDILQGRINGERKVLENSPELRHLGTTITPDGNSLPLIAGSKILLCDLRSGTTEVFKVVPRLTNRASSFNKKILEAAISPNGTEAVVTTSGGSGFAATVYAKRSTSPGRLLHSSSRIIMRPKWLPDGSGVILIEQEENGWTVSEVNSSNGARRVLYRSGVFIETAELHPDQVHLLLTLGQSPEWQGYCAGLHVYEMDLNSGKMVRAYY
jgi:hypothetical protein